MPIQTTIGVGNPNAESFFLRAQRRRGLGEAGSGYLQANYDPRWKELIARDAQSFDQASNAATMAVGADSGSIAARNNPFQYGSIASQKFGVFGHDGTSGFDSLNAQTTDSNQGMMRRSLYSALTQSGGENGSGT